MLEALEELHDVAAYDIALAETGANIPWEQVSAISAGRERLSD